MVFKKNVALLPPPSSTSTMSTFIDNATSQLLDSPDLAINLAICDFLNSNPGQARDMLKLVKKKIGIKNCKVQLLAMTALEMVMKNCGENVHRIVAEKGILQEMVQIAKKTADKTVRDKILLLLDSWQEEFGGASGKYPQFYTTYRELQRSGIEFPEHKWEDFVPIFTPPTTQSRGMTTSQSQSDHEVVDDALWRHVDGIRQEVEVLNEMLNALDPSDKQAIKDDVIVQLVEQCRIEQRSIGQLVDSITNESLLIQTLSVNDDLQQVLQSYDIISSNLSSDDERKLLSRETDAIRNDDLQVAELIHRHRSSSKSAVRDEANGSSVPAGSLGALSSDTTRGRDQGRIDQVQGTVLSPQWTNVPSTSSQAEASRPNPEHTTARTLDSVSITAESPQRYPPSPANRPVASSSPQYSPVEGKTRYKGENISATTVSKLPPPPIRYSERERFFEERKQVINRFRASENEVGRRNGQERGKFHKEGRGV